MICKICFQSVRQCPTTEAWFHDLGPQYRSIETIAREVVSVYDLKGNR